MFLHLTISPPYGISKMNSESSPFPPKVVICRCLIMACCMLPITLKNYVTGLSQVNKNCDDFNIQEAECMPASEYISTFVTTHGAGLVSKGVIKTWILGLELWHHNNSALWHRGAELQ